jgi:hypothetical protein
MDIITKYVDDLITIKRKSIKFYKERGEIFVFCPLIDADKTYSGRPVKKLNTLREVIRKCRNMLDPNYYIGHYHYALLRNMDYNAQYWDYVIRKKYTDHKIYTQYNCKGLDPIDAVDFDKNTIYFYGFEISDLPSLMDRLYKTYAGVMKDLCCEYIICVIGYDILVQDRAIYCKMSRLKEIQKVNSGMPCTTVDDISEYL